MVQAQSLVLRAYTYLSCLAVDAFRLPLGTRDRTLQVLATSTVVGEHIDHDEIRNRGRRFFTEVADAGRRQGAFGGIAERRYLRIGGPDRVGIVGLKEWREIALRRRNPRIELVGFLHERSECLAGLRILGELERQN